MWLVQMVLFAHKQPLPAVDQDVPCAQAAWDCKSTRCRCQCPFSVLLPGKMQQGKQLLTVSPGAPASPRAPFSPFAPWAERRDTR